MRYPDASRPMFAVRVEWCNRSTDWHCCRTERQAFNIATQHAIARRVTTYRIRYRLRKRIRPTL